MAINLNAWYALGDLPVPPVPVPITPAGLSAKVLLKTQLIWLTQGDVDILDGSINRSVRIDKDEDVEVKRLYHIYKSL